MKTTSSRRFWHTLALPLLAAAVMAACTPTAPEPLHGNVEPSPAPTLEPTEAPAPPEPLAWGPTEADLEAAIERAGEFSDEELASFVIVPRYDGTAAEVPAGLVAEGFSGAILFSANIESLPQLQEVAGAVQEAALTRGWDWPAIMAVDNEGGIVQRLSAEVGPWTTFPPFAAAQFADAVTISEAMAAMARELRATGFNTNYAPVADITGPGDAAIGSRAPADATEPAALAVTAAVEGFIAGGILPAVKHFPGHGGLAVDSHVALPVQTKPVTELAKREFVPFKAGIEAGAAMVMMGHISIPEWSDGAAASLAAEAYDYLRDDLGFTGVTITDGLDMGALGEDSGEIALRAMGAGADILLTPADPRAAREGLLAALADGSLERERLEEAAGRIIAMMRHQETIAADAGPVSDDDVGAAKEAAARLAGG